MNTINNLVSSSIGNQLPSFIANEYPLFVDFIQNYYQQLEKSGESLDLINNLLKYLDIDFYQNTISSSCILVENITNNTIDITVDSTDGFPDVDGLIQIDSEIILYKSKTSNQFLSCSRGVSGVTSVGSQFTYSYSTSAEHKQNSQVINLSYLFIFYFLSKIKNNYLQNFSGNFIDGLNLSNLTKNVKDFYNAKGTSQSFDFIIRSLFNESNQTIYPREYVIRPSDAIYESKEIIKCKSIIGDPINLVGNRLTQILNYDPCSNNNEANSYVDVISVERIFTENQEFYEITIACDSSGFDIKLQPKTKIVNNVLNSDNKIIVDSTIGFPSTGILKIENELIKYTDKTINEFLNCTRAYCNTTARSYEISTEVSLSNILYYDDGVDRIELNLIGIASGYQINDNLENYFPNDLVTSSKLGYTDNSILTKSWIFNAPKLLKVVNYVVDNTSLILTTEYNHNLLLDDEIFIYGFSVSSINGLKQVTRVISDTQFSITISSLLETLSGNPFIQIPYKLGNQNIPADVINVYDQNNEYLYIASAGVPSYQIGLGTTIGNQRYLKRIPRNKLGTGSTVVSSSSVGIFKNGVLAKSCISDFKITYGEIIDINIENSGDNYQIGEFGSPTLSIDGNAELTCQVNGSIKKINVLSGGTGFVSRPAINIAGNGSGAKAEAIISNGSIVSVIVTDIGTGYTSFPQITVSGGGGYGATLVPEVSGPIKSVSIVNAGTGYSSIPNVTVNEGSGALAAPVISNGKIVDVVLLAGGSGYNAPPKVFINDSTGLGTGAEIIATISSGSVTDFTIINSGINYTEGLTTLSLVPSGSGAVIVPIVREWTYNKFNSTNKDESNGFIELGKIGKYGNEYSYIANPKKLRRQLSDNINFSLIENTINLTHSPILGWAYDGNPIYGPYGYSDPLDLSSSVTKITSGYTLNGSRTNGPSTTIYPLGTFVEDYSYTSGLLDRNNGRYCLTPEFPLGTYAYFITIDSNNNPAFPYIIGSTYEDYYDSWNTTTFAVQENLPSDVLRYRLPFDNLDIDSQRKIPNEDPFVFLQEDGLSFILQEDNTSFITGETLLEVYNYFPTITKNSKFSVKNTISGSEATIDSFTIENSGENYKVNDRLLFDNSNTNGYGASAKVGRIVGVGITNASVESLFKIKLSDINGAFAKNTSIFGISSGTGATVKYVNYDNSEIYVNKSSNFISNELLVTNYNSVFSTGISTITSTSISSGYTSTSLSSEVSEIDATLIFNSPSNINIGDSLIIDSEIVKVFSGSGNTYNVFRTQFGTTSSGHTSGTEVKLLPTITVNNSSILEVGNYVKIDNEVFRIVDINNSENTISLLRGQLGSSLSSHTLSSVIRKVNISSATYSSGNTSYVAGLSTGLSSYLIKNDSINVSSGSTHDEFYTGSYKVLDVNSGKINYEIPNFGSGYSGSITYTTNSLSASGPISEIQIISSGQYYNLMPNVEVVSETGFGATILPVSENSGKIIDLQIDDFGYDLNPDYTLKPELTFPQILKLNRTLSLQSAIVQNGGSGYQYIPFVDITGGGGTGAQAVANINNKKVVSIEITNPGYGYNSNPTISVKRSFPCFINVFNSTLNFSFNVSESFNTGDPVRITSSGTNPVLFGGIQLTSNLVVYAIIGGSLDSNQLQIALTESNASSGANVQFASSGTGNISAIAESGNAVIIPVLDTLDFQEGEKIYQYDNSNNLIASATVSNNYGWNSSSKTLRVINVEGEFKLNQFRIIGEKSKASGFIYDNKSSSGFINPDSIGTKVPEFITNVGFISNNSQNIIDSNYYQDYSYALKNNIDYINWSSEVKNTAHPSGFKLFGNRLISTGASHSTGITESSFIDLNQNLFRDLSLSTYKNFAISQPDYSTSLKDQVTIFNRQLTSSERIITSKVDKIDDISNLVTEYVGTGSTNVFYLNDRIKDIVRKDDITVVVDDITLPISNYDLQFEFDSNFNVTKAKVVFDSIPNLNSSIIINCIGLNFDGVNKNFPLTFNGLTKSYNNNQILITLNGIIQTEQSYEISQKTILTFTEVPYSNAKLTIFRVSTGSTSSTIVGTGATVYSIGAGISTAGSFVTIDGVLQNSDSYTITNNTITFTEPLEVSAVAHVRDFGSGISSKELYTLGSSTTIVPISSNISTGSSNSVVSVNGIVQLPSTYQIGSGSTCIIFNETIESGSTVYICNFGNNINYFSEIDVDGLSSDFILDENISGSDSYIVVIDGAVQVSGTSYAYYENPQNIENINFYEPPKPRTKFYGLLYNRKDPSENAVIDNISKTYFTYNTLSGNLVTNDYLQVLPNGPLCIVNSLDTTNKLVVVTGAGSTFGVGQTLISGLSSSISTGITTYVTTGSGITIGANSFSVGSTVGLEVNNYINVGGEVMRVTNISSGTSALTVTRGLVSTPVTYHAPDTFVNKIIPTEFTINSVNKGFTGTGITYTLTTGGNPFNYNGTSFSLPSAELDAYGQNYSESLIAILNGINQDNNALGSFTLSGDQITFNESPKEGLEFYGRYIGKLRRLNDISNQFNGTKLSFNLNIENNIIYSLIPPDPSVDISNNVLIFVNGVLQNPGESFTVLGSRIIFSEPPRPGTTFLGYVYIGSDEDVSQSNILAPIEKNDTILIDGENEIRDILSVDSSSSVSTLGYFGNIDGTGASATVNIADGKVTNIIVNNQGSGYFEPPIIYFRGGGGFGASANAIVSNGRIVSIQITNSGANYTSAPEILFLRNLTLNKKERVRSEYDSTYRKVTTLGTGLTFGSGSSLPAINQTVGIANTSGFNLSGAIKIIDDSRPYFVSELITYNNISGTNLTGCVRGVGFNFNKVLQLGTGSSTTFSSGMTITNGSGATANIINWDFNNKLLFVNKISTTDFNDSDIIQGTGITITDAEFIRTYLSYGSGTTVIQIF